MNTEHFWKGFLAGSLVMSLAIGVFLSALHRLHSSPGDKEPCLVNITDHKIVVDCTLGKVK